MRKDREIDLLPSKVVGRRREAPVTPHTTDVLLQTAGAMRGGAGMPRRGLYRFETFEEAQEWMRTQASRKSGHRRSTTSGASAERSRTRGRATS